MMSDRKEKLNIAMVCDPIGSNKSGVVVSTLRFSKLLRERGHHVIFIGARSREHPTHSYHDGIKAYRYQSIPVPKSGGWHLAFPTVKELKKVFEQEKINVVHILLPMSGAIIAIKAAKALNIKIVAHSLFSAGKFIYGYAECYSSGPESPVEQISRMDVRESGIVNLSF